MEQAIIADSPKTSIFHKEVSASIVNLLLLLAVAALILIDVLFRSYSMNWEQLRVFTIFTTDVDLLDKLLPLRVCLGYVFFWYGVDNLEHPEVFNSLSNIILKKFKLEKDKLKLYPFGYVQSSLELLVGFSLITGIFMDLGALIASLLLFAVLFAYEEGLGSLLVRDVGLLGASISLFLVTVLHF